MFKRISIFLIVLLTVLCFVSGASATALTIVKPADNSYIEYLSGAVSILKIGPTSVVTTNWTTTNTYSSMAVTDSTDTSLTVNSIVTAGGIACTKRLWLGDDIDMSTNATTTYDIVLNDAQADALSITREGTDIIVFNTTTPSVTITPVVTITGLLTSSGGITVGTSGVGETVTFYGDNAGSDFVWAEAGDTNGSLTLGASTDGCDFRVYGTTATTYLHWDNDVDDLLLVGEATQLAVAGTATSGSTTTGSLRTAGGLGVVENANIGGTVGIAGAVTIGGAVGITGNVTLVSTSKLYFLDTELYIYSSANGVLDIVSDTTLKLTAPTITVTGQINLEGNVVLALGIGSTTPLTTATTNEPTVIVQSNFSGNGYHMAQYVITQYTTAGGYGTVRAIVGVADLSATQTTNTSAQYIVGVHGRGMVSGTAYNTALCVTGVHGQILAGGTWTAANHVSAIWADWHLAADTSAANSTELLYLTNNANNAGADTNPDNIMFVYGPYVDNFIYFSGCGNGGMTDTSAAAAEARTGRIRISVDGSTRYIYYYD